MNDDSRNGALRNGLAVLEMFRVDRPVITVSEIGRHLDVHKSSASRIAATLVSTGYLARAAEGQGFRLSGKLARLGSLAANDTYLTELSTPIVRRLVEEVGETCHVGVLEGREAVTVVLVDGSYSFRLHSFVGKRSPAHCTAMGKVLLAGLAQDELEELFYSVEEPLTKLTNNSIDTKAELFAALSQIRQDGFAIDNEELERGLVCVAAPISNHEGRTVASLTIAGATARLRDSLDAEYAPLVCAAADEISVALGSPLAGAPGALRDVVPAT
ncbi:IclR family transcriptional regulator [Microbacterium sp. E-13]|uniref:IclR family transcriptional regulator n=1 Tax=Microbacterium sp. E-13 TaxID=3404048 RepID=UPI003CF66ADE